MKLNHILEGIEVLSIVGNEDIEVLNVEYDSRKVEEGTLFICIKGFVSDIIERKRRYFLWSLIIY